MKPEDVFTPRSALVNVGMYVERPDLELALRNGLRGNLHLLIHGESGTGKSWLYKKVFTDLGVTFLVANLANASRRGSIDAELRGIVDRESPTIKTGYEEEKSASIKAVLAEGELKHTAEYAIQRLDPLEECFRLLRKRAGGSEGGPAVLVMDNLEAAFTPELLKQLADMIILCDDERYADYRVKLVIVGVPGGVKEYYYRTPHHASVANRLHEMPEVSRLSPAECEQLVQRGFIEKLQYDVVDLHHLVASVAWVTDRVPQLVHEYCLQVAYQAEAKKKVSTIDVISGGSMWVSHNAYHAYAIIESNMNERDTRAGRRNQTLYVLGRCSGEEFKASEIEQGLRREFPTSTKDTALNTAQVLAQLADSDRPVVRRSPKGDAFTFADARYRSVLRAMLVKTQDEKVDRRPVSRSN